MGFTRMAVTTKTRGKDESPMKMTPEIFFARKLASNEKKIRDKFLKKLKKWISARSKVSDAFSDDELLKLWKGLFYCMWMSDKPLIQEDLAETIASLIHSIVDRKTGLNFFKISLVTMGRDWSGIDTWRMDKFMMFVRRIVRHSLEYLAENSWNEEEVAIYSNILSECIVNANKNTALLKVPVGLRLHITAMFPEELAKAGGDDLNSPTILKLLEPFAKCLATSNDQRLKKEITQHVFIYLIKQTDEALEYENNEFEIEKFLPQEKVKSSKRRKAVANANQEAEEAESEKAEAEAEAVGEDDEEMGQDDEDDDLDMDADAEEGNFNWGAKDPRAGGVDVVLPQLNPDFAKVAEMLLEIASDQSVRNKNRQPIHRLVKRFQDLSKGVYPLKLKLPKVGLGLTPNMMRQASRRFLKEELYMSEKKEMEKKSFKASQTAVRNKRQELEELSENLLNDSEQLDDEVESDEEAAPKDNGEDGSCEEEDEGEDEEETNCADEETVNKEDEEKAISKEDKEKAKPSTTAKDNKEPKKSEPVTIKPVSKFEVDDDWSDDLPKDVPMKQLKHKLKAQKRLKSSWIESPLKGETEIVIPNKKYKGSVQLKAAPREPEEIIPENKNRRVNFHLNKNTSQKHMDYQRTLRNSPGIPHDPDRQPSGGVLKRTSMGSAKPPTAVKDPQTLSKRQRRSMK